ncbi:unnamed protein product, partial [Effrenium voratum]
EVRVQLNQEELLISLTALVQPLGARGCYLSHPGLHPAVAWVLARCLDIQDQEVVLDPMCGKGVLLCEAAMNWPRAGAFLGCDLDVAQLRKAVDNLRSAARSVQLCRADAAVKLPLAEQSVDKILTDLPFGRQFGSVEENQRLYPRVLAEMRRVIRPQGLAAVLTSSANKDHMRAAASLAAGWAVEHQRSFRLFAKTDACIYLLRPVGPVGPVGAGGARPAPRKAKGGAFGWEDGSSWHAQWARARPALVLFGEKETTGGVFEKAKGFAGKGGLCDACASAGRSPMFDRSVDLPRGAPSEHLLDRLQLAAAAGPGLRGANESETREDLWHPWCSVSVSKRVRAHVDEGIKDVLPKLPANCPFHPRADLLNYSKGGSSSGHVCMASFCEMFGVCEEPSEICVDAQMAEQKRRCEGAVLRCFPPGDVDMSIRQKHSQFTRRCKELDCQVRAHRASEERAGLTSISPLLALVASSCLAAFAAMLLLVGRWA